jgi:hypothetical protein
MHFLVWHFPAQKRSEILIVHSIQAKPEQQQQRNLDFFAQI